MKNSNIAKITFTLEVDHDKKEMIFKVNNKMQSKSYTDSPESAAGMYRDIAAYALEMAFNMEHSDDFVQPSFMNADREEQARKCCEEHTNLFEAEKEENKR